MRENQREKKEPKIRTKRELDDDKESERKKKKEPNDGALRELTSR